MANVFRSRLLAACVAGLLAGAAAQADVTMQEQMSLSGSGMMKMANMTGTTTTVISGDRARTESAMRFESAMMRTFAGGMGDHVEIVRLGEDKIFSLNPKKKTYTETTFAEQRAKMQEAMDAMNKSQASQQQATSGVDESECEWSEPRSELKRTGERALIAGFQAERISITATQSCKSKKDPTQVCDFGLAFDQWLAPGFEASNEAQNYQRAYAEKLGLGTASQRDFAERAQSMFGRYKGIWAELGKRMAEIDAKGYAVKSGFSLGVGGPQCQNTQAVQEQGGPQSPPSIGGALGGALGGMFKKKQQEPQPQAAAPPPTMAGGLMPLMGMTTELISISRDAAPPQAFEVPTDYKKTKD